MKNLWLASIVFIIGCIAGGVAGEILVPPVRAGTNPVRWEYNCVNGNANLGEQLNQYGAAGWEMVSAFASHLEHEYEGGLHANNDAFCFKRALP
jgi:hypothetical protein